MVWTGNWLKRNTTRSAPSTSDGDEIGVERLLREPLLLRQPVPVDLRRVVPVAFEAADHTVRRHLERRSRLSHARRRVRHAQTQRAVPLGLRADVLHRRIAVVRAEVQPVAALPVGQELPTRRARVQQVPQACRGRVRHARPALVREDQEVRTRGS